MSKFPTAAPVVPPPTEVHRHRASRGMTLIEVMIGMGIFAIGVASIVSGLVFSQRVAEQNLLRETALTVAQTYLENLKSIPWTDISGADATPTVFTGLGNTVLTRTPLTNNTTVTLPPFDFRNTPAFAGDDMTITLRVNVTPAPNADAFHPVSARNIVLAYNWSVGSGNARTAGSGVLRVTRSNAQTLSVSTATPTS